MGGVEMMMFAIVTTTGLTAMKHMETVRNVCVRLSVLGWMRHLLEVLPMPSLSARAEVFATGTQVNVTAFQVTQGKDVKEQHAPMSATVMVYAYPSMSCAQMLETILSGLDRTFSKTNSRTSSTTFGIMRKQWDVNVMHVGQMLTAPEEDARETGLTCITTWFFSLKSSISSSQMPLIHTESLPFFSGRAWEKSSLPLN
jgi:hypothetical protein